MDYLWVIVFSEDIYYQINIADLYWFKKKPHTVLIKFHLY